MKKAATYKKLPLRVSVLMAVLFMAACAKGPPPELYLLDAQAPAYLPGLEQGIAIGVGPIEMSRYLDRNSIVTRSDTPKLGVSGQHQWAEPLKAGVSRVLLVNLGLSLDSNRIYELPMRRRRPLDYQVPMDVLRFDGVVGRDVILSVRWTLLDGSGDEVLLSRVSRIIEPANGADVEAMVEAQSRALVKLAGEIADAIKAQSPIK